MQHLYQLLREQTQKWSEAGYPCEEFPAIAEILRYQMLENGHNTRFLRRPQLRALETYWYLRLVKETPHIFKLYESLYKSKSDLIGALGIPKEAFDAVDYELPKLWKKTKQDDAFVREFKLHALRETLTLDYPSYIFALAMGAGKTILIGAILATEFALALEYPNGPFVQNALVFAPGKTIIESLRELSQVPYEKLLPPRLHKEFAASVKLTFTRDGEKDIPVIRGSSFNVVVTNTEKIRIQKENIRRSELGKITLSLEEQEKARQEVANLRLQAIASLPHLAIFSDEAHHTYGQSLDTELKRVRQTVDYLNKNSPNLICVVNTTGTPYFQRQPLKDVVIWYGLSEGIKDDYLKDLAGSIQAYDFSDDASKYVEYVVKNFFQDYGPVRLPNGAPAKLAIYFPQTDDLKELKPFVDKALVEVGESPAICLVNTSDETITKQADIDAFNRLNDPESTHRVMLLVNKGTEGWNCPSLFACALARKLKTSNNFVLQASTRCLRQVPGNDRKARVYLSSDNFGVLDRQLQETYGETISDLNHSSRNLGHARITLRKLNLPPLVIRRIVRTVVKKDMPSACLHLQRPVMDIEHGQIRTFTTAERQSPYGGRVLVQVGESKKDDSTLRVFDVYEASVELAARYRLDARAVCDELRRLYGNEDIPNIHLDHIAKQIEEQFCNYKVNEETVEDALALVKLDGFDKNIENGVEIYTADITYPKDREDRLAKLEKFKDSAGNFGFHYDPYDFDSGSEYDYFEQVLQQLKLTPAEVEDIYFTGALTDPAKTDFFVEYRDEEGKPRRYTPDFIIRRRDGRCLIVEIKDARFQAQTNEDIEKYSRGEPAISPEGRKAIALKKWVKLNPDKLKYELIFARDTIGHDQMRPTREFIEESSVEA